MITTDKYTNFETLCSNYPDGRIKTALNALAVYLQNPASYTEKIHNDNIKNYIFKVYNPKFPITPAEQTLFSNACKFYSSYNSDLGLAAMFIGLVLVAVAGGFIGAGFISPGAFFVAALAAVIGAACITGGANISIRGSIHDRTQEVIATPPTFNL